MSDPSTEITVITKPIGPTAHLETVDYWKGLYLDAVAVGQEALDALRATRKRLAPLRCPSCDGSGVYEEQHDYATEALGCPDCEASGYLPAPAEMLEWVGSASGHMLGHVGAYEEECERCHELCAALAHPVPECPGCVANRVNGLSESEIAERHATTHPLPEEPKPCDQR